jgi:transposase
MTQLTYRQAAARVDRSPRTIRHWRQQGMPMGWDIRDGQHVRVVDEEVLLAWFRARLQAWPTHRWRMRRKLAELETSD